MKAPKMRQKLLLGGAGLCLLIVVPQLLAPRGSLKTPSAAPTAPKPSERESPALNISSLPEFYQNLKVELAQITPARDEPFRTTPSAFSNPAPTSEPSALPRSSLPLLPPLTLQGIGDEQIVESGGTVPSVERILNQSTISTNETKATNQEPSPPRLLGLVRNAQTGRMEAALEWNGQIITAEPDPHAEWQLVEVTPTSVRVRHDGQEYRRPRLPAGAKGEEGGRLP